MGGRGGGGAGEIPGRPGAGQITRDHSPLEGRGGGVGQIPAGSNVGSMKTIAGI